MSRSNNVDLKNPAVMTIDWQGGDGILAYYDKESQKNVEIPMPFTFMVLDILTTIRGFSDADKSGYWSNEIRNIKTDELTIKTKKGIEATGLYENIFSRCTGAKYCQSVYVAVQLGQEYQIARLHLYGSAIGAWIDFRKKTNVMQGAVVINDKTAEKKGKTDYFSPVFTWMPVSGEENVIANKLDAELQEYLNAYLKRHTVVSEPVITDDFIPEQHEHVEQPRSQKPDLPHHSEIPSNGLPF